MKLCEEPFYKIKSGEKKVELRLNDEKRREVKIGDVIEFTKLPNLDDSIQVKVNGLLQFQSFKDLFLTIDLKVLGKKELSINERINRVRKIYSKEKEEKFGVLGIYIEKI